MITDFLIVGSGIAGLSLALKLSTLGNVLVITKKRKAESNTNYAQGGIASVLADDDNFEIHIKDTMSCGGELSKIEAVRKIVREGPQRIYELIDLGVKFTRENGRLVLGKEGGHSRSRIVHSKDLTGREIERALLHEVSINKNIEVFEYYMAIDLLTNRNMKSHSAASNGKFRFTKENRSNNSCYGIYAYNIKDRRVEKIIARRTILATGGLGQVYLHTTNPAIATGDGFAMGYRAGCVVDNMEFVQFHPTSLYEKEIDDDSQVFLISEAVRGAGAVLKTKDGKEFMHKYDKRKSLAPRDIVARAIDNEMKKRGDSFVYLDVSPIGSEKLKNQFPNIYKTCLSKGIDITKEMIPVVPAAHYACGGLQADLDGKTTLRNLYACGEVAMTGVHGANRLASNSLLEAVVFSDAIYKNIKNDIKNVFPKGYVNEDLKKLDAKVLEWNDKGTNNADEWVLVSHDKMEIKEIMNDYVGIVRNTVRLQRAYRRIKMLKEEIKEYYTRTKVTVELLELRNLVTVAYMIIESAMKRRESRGLHYMLDYPKKDDKNFKKDTRLVKS
ncbi:MAG: L-aspartate oxidase [Ignavibacteria bacterium]|jgi:L-aspartate oxidase|nr:L-aspartate oxidase [Ignavibacteria bacterium]